jgi:hypothetical protein
VDPNAALERIRLNLSDWERYRLTGAAEMLDDIVNEVFESFTGLDRWLNSGGFPPADWLHGPPASPEQPCEGVSL